MRSEQPYYIRKSGAHWFIRWPDTWSQAYPSYDAAKAAADLVPGAVDRDKAT